MTKLPSFPITEEAALTPLAKAFSESARQAALEARRAKAKQHVKNHEGESTAGGGSGDSKTNDRQMELNLQPRLETDKELYEQRPSRELRQLKEEDLKGDTPFAKEYAASWKNMTEKRSKVGAEWRKGLKQAEAKYGKLPSYNNVDSKSSHALFAANRESYKSAVKELEAAGKEVQATLRRHGLKND